MAIYDASLARVRTSATIGGTYALIGYVTSFNATEGSEGDTSIPYFGGEVVTSGSRTLEGTFDVIWDLADTSGQNALRTAHRAGTTIALEFSPGGTDTGAPYEKYEAVITEVSRSVAADGDNSNGSFSFRGAPSTLATGTHA